MGFILNLFIHQTFLCISQNNLIQATIPPSFPLSSMPSYHTSSVLWYFLFAYFTKHLGFFTFPATKSFSSWIKLFNPNDVHQWKGRKGEGGPFFYCIKILTAICLAALHTKVSRKSVWHPPPPGCQFHNIIFCLWACFRLSSPKSFLLSSYRFCCGPDFSHAFTIANLREPHKVSI